MYLSTREAVPHAGFGFPSSAIIGSDVGTGYMEKYNSQDTYSFMHPYEGVSHTHYNANQSYGLSSLNLRTIVAGQIRKNQEESWYTKYALPRVNINNNKIQYSTIVFENALAELTPDEGVPKIISSQIHSSTRRLQRRAIGLLSEESYRNTENGSKMYALSIQHLATVVNDTQNYDVIMAYFNCEKYDIQWERTNGYYNGKTMFDIFKRDVDSFASIQKGGFAKMDASVGSIHTRYGLDILDMWILPREVRTFLGVVPEEYRLYNKGGPEAVEQLKNGIGLLYDDAAPPLIFGNLYKVFFTRTFATGENQNPLNPMLRRRIIGEYFPQVSEYNQKGSEYKSIYRAIKVYDEDLDDYVLITLEDSLNAIKYMFNVDGDDLLKNADDLVGSSRFNINNFDNDIKQHFLYKSYENDNNSSISDNYGLKPIQVIGEMKQEHFSNNSLIEMAKSIVKFTVNRLDCDLMCEELYNDFHAGIELVTKFRKMSIGFWLKSLLQDFDNSYSSIQSESDNKRYMNTYSVSVLPYDQISGSSITRKLKNIMEKSLVIDTHIKNGKDDDKDDDLKIIEKFQSDTKITIDELIPFLTNWSGLLFLSQVKMSPIIESFKNVKTTITKFVESVKKITSVLSQTLNDCSLLDINYTPPFYPMKSKELVFLNSLDIFNNVYPLWTSRKNEKSSQSVREKLLINMFDSRIHYYSNFIKMAKSIYTIIKNNKTFDIDKMFDYVLKIVRKLMPLSMTEVDSTKKVQDLKDELEKSAKSKDPKEKSKIYVVYVINFNETKYLITTDIFYKIMELTTNFLESISENRNNIPADFFKIIGEITKSKTYDNNNELLFNDLFKNAGNYKARYDKIINDSSNIQFITSTNNQSVGISAKVDRFVGKSLNTIPTRTTFSLHKNQMLEYINFLNQQNYNDFEIPHITISLPTTHFNKPATFGEIKKFYDSIKDEIKDDKIQHAYDNDNVIDEGSFTLPNGRDIFDTRDIKEYEYWTNIYANIIDGSKSDKDSAIRSLKEILNLNSKRNRKVVTKYTTADTEKVDSFESVGSDGDEYMYSNTGDGDYGYAMARDEFNSGLDEPLLGGNNKKRTGESKDPKSTSYKMSDLIDYSKYEERKNRVKRMVDNYKKSKNDVDDDCSDSECNDFQYYNSLFEFICAMNIDSFGSNPTLENNYKMLSNKPMTLLDKVVSISILLTPFKYSMLYNLIDKNIILPIGFLHMRPFMRYDTLAGIKARAGSDTGNTFINSDQNNTMDGVSVEVQTHLKHVSYESAAIITNNRLVLVVYDMFCFKCCGGAGTKFYDMEDLQYFSSTRHQYPNDKSIIVAPLPYEEREFPNPLDAAGSFSYFSVQGSSRNSKSNVLHYSTAPLMNGIFNFREKTENQEIEFWNYHPQSDGTLTPNVNPKSTIMFRGYYGYTDSRIGQMVMRAGTGHFKSYAYPGCKYKRNGGLTEWISPLLLYSDDQNNHE